MAGKTGLNAQWNRFRRSWLFLATRISQAGLIKKLR
jgi:hypothetical protein